MHRIFAGVEFIFRGGWMMFPLLISGIIALAVIFERIYTFKKIYITPPNLAQKIFKLIRKNNLEEAKALCMKTETPITSVLLSGIEHFENPLEEMELCMKNQAEAWVPLLERRVDWIDTIITAAPLLGLLGTITGMMDSFQVLSEKGVNEPNAITGGVAEALIATATGLVIALLGLVAYNGLTNRVKVFIYEIESMASRLVELRLSYHRNQLKNKSTEKNL